MSSLYEGNSPFPPRPEAEYFTYEEKIDQLHQTRELFSVACDRYLDRPRGRREEDLLDTSSALTRSFLTAVHAIVDDPELVEDRSSLIAGLFIAEDREIVSLYNSLAKVPLCTPCTQSMDQYTSNVSLMFERFYDDSRGLKAELAKIFVKDFGYDSKKFIAFAQDKAAKKRVQIAHRVGHIGVDISMLAIGASIGAWVAKRKHE